MKKLGFLFVLAVILLINTLARGQQFGTRAAFGVFSVTNLHTVATNIVSTNLFVTKVTLMGLQRAGVSNSAAIYVGPNTNSQPYYIAPGERHVIVPNPGTYYNLKDWYFKTSLNDGITVIYQ